MDPIYNNLQHDNFENSSIDSIISEDDEHIKQLHKALQPKTELIKQNKKSEKYSFWSRENLLSKLDKFKRDRSSSPANIEAKEIMDKFIAGKIKEKNDQNINRTFAKMHSQPNESENFNKFRQSTGKNNSQQF